MRDGLTEKSVRIGGNEFRLFGSEDDPYYINIQAFMDNSGELTRLVEHHIPSDAVCFDIGANIGLMTLLIASRCPQGHVYSFEPDQNNARFLKENLAINSIDNCTVIETGVGYGTNKLRFCPSGAGGHVMTKAHIYRDKWKAIEIPVTSIDQFVTERRIERLDMIKIDVEGFEPMVLAGARRTIARFKPIIFLEFNSWCLYFAHRFDPMSFARSLWDAFDVLSIGADGALAPAAGGDPIRFLHDNMVQHGCVDDLVLRPRGPVPSLGAMTGHHAGFFSSFGLTSAFERISRIWASR